MDEKSVLAKSRSVVCTRLPEGAVLLNAESKYFYTLNESAYALWQAINGKRQFGAIIRLISARYHMDEALVMKQARKQAAQFLKEGLVRMSG